MGVRKDFLWRSRALASLLLVLSLFVVATTSVAQDEWLDNLDALLEPIPDKTVTSNIEAAVLNEFGPKLSSSFQIEGSYEARTYYAASGKQQKCLIVDLGGETERVCATRPEHEDDRLFVSVYFIENPDLGRFGHVRMFPHQSDSFHYESGEPDPLAGVEIDIISECEREGWEFAGISQDGVIEIRQREMLKDGNGCKLGNHIIDRKHYALVVYEDGSEIGLIVSWEN